jgi:hypothetical protein
MLLNIRTKLRRDNIPRITTSEVESRKTAQDGLQNILQVVRSLIQVLGLLITGLSYWF